MDRHNQHQHWFLTGGLAMSPALGKLLIPLLITLVAGATWRCSLGPEKSRPPLEATACSVASLT